MTAIETVSKVRSSAAIAAKPSARTPGALGKLDFTRQGDVYFWKLDGVPKVAMLVKSPSAQLAPGNTQGSRHCIADLASVKVYRLANPNALQGVVIDAPNGVEITHPEHGHHQLGAGTYAVTFQRAYAEELRRVQD